MYTDLKKTLTSIDRNIPDDLSRAYDYTLRLRSQLLSLIQDREAFSASAEQERTLAECKSAGQNSGGVVTLTVYDPLPAQKELTEAVEEHWKAMIHNAIREAAWQKPLPWYEKAFVEIEIVTPSGSNNIRVWDTSNRAIQVIFNNLKGIFFLDDDMEHMAFSVVGRWGEGVGETVIRVWDFDKWKQIEAQLLGTP